MKTAQQLVENSIAYQALVRLNLANRHRPVRVHDLFYSALALLVNLVHTLPAAIELMYVSGTMANELIDSTPNTNEKSSTAMTQVWVMSLLEISAQCVVNNARSAGNTAEVPLFLQLPPELRNAVYQYALGSATHLNPKDPRSTRRTSRTNRLALLCVNRQLYTETSLLPFSYDTFVFLRMSGVEEFLRQQTAAQIQALQTITLVTWRGGFLIDEGTTRTISDKSGLGLEAIAQLSGLEKIEIRDLFGSVLDMADWLVNVGELASLIRVWKPQVKITAKWLVDEEHGCVTAEQVISDEQTDG